MYALPSGRSIELHGGARKSTTPFLSYVSWGTLNEAGVYRGSPSGHRMSGAPDWVWVCGCVLLNHIGINLPMHSTLKKKKEKVITLWGNCTYPWVVSLLITGARKLTPPKKHAEGGVLTASGINVGGGT